MLEKFLISVATCRVTKIMDSWLKDTYITCGYSRGYKIKFKKKSEKDAVYFQPEGNHEARITK